MPSGVDLAAQCVGGLARFDPRAGEAKPLAPVADLGRLLIFSASSQPGRKVPTHTHLASLAALGFPRTQDREWCRQLGEWVERGVAALVSHDGGFGAVLDGYANQVAAAGFECEATYADRIALRALPGVDGCKGTGALQADVLVVWLAVHATPEQKLAVIVAARARGLRWIERSAADADQAGILCS